MPMTWIDQQIANGTPTSNSRGMDIFWQKWNDTKSMGLMEQLEYERLVAITSRYCEFWLAAINAMLQSPFLFF